MLTVPDDYSVLYILESSPEPQPLCPRNVAWIKKDLGHCDTYHRIRSTSTFRPTRLLDLDAKGSNKDFRLITTLDDHASRELRYAAVSYCWGSEEHAKKQLKTLSCNVHQHHDLILFDSVTPVVQDAVTTARALAIRYLWIDALCKFRTPRKTGQTNPIRWDQFMQMHTSLSAHFSAIRVCRDFWTVVN